MTIMLFGEGKTDYGQPVPDGWQEGPVQEIIRKMFPEIRIDFINIPKSEIDKYKIQRRHSDLKGKATVSYRLGIIANNLKIAKVICYSDADREQCTRNDKLHFERRFFKIHDEIANGFLLFGNGVSGIPMVPLTMIECWLLSDEGAFQKGFPRCPQDFRLPPKPEYLWGRKLDPTSDYPKHVLERILHTCKIGANFDFAYLIIAEHVKPEMITAKCPLSFGRLIEDIKLLDISN